MRCDKCGYISFDYLSECKKCRTSLTAARESIGFPALKPAAPFLLRSLLESGLERENNLAEVETLTSFGLAEKAEASSGLGEEGILGFLKQETGSEVIRQPLEIEGTDGPEEDFSLLDLSDEEIELLIDKDALEGDDAEAIVKDDIADSAGLRPSEHLSVSELEPPAAGLSLPEVEAAAEAGAREPAETEAITARDDCHQTPDIEIGVAPDMQEFAVNPTDLEVSDPSPQAHSAIPGSEVSEDHPSPAAGSDKRHRLGKTPEVRAEQVRPQLDNPANDFVIEFSENEFDAFLEELGSTPEGPA